MDLPWFPLEAPFPLGWACTCHTALGQLGQKDSPLPASTSHPSTCVGVVFGTLCIPRPTRPSSLGPWLELDFPGPALLPQPWTVQAPKIHLRPSLLSPCWLWDILGGWGPDAQHVPQVGSTYHAGEVVVRQVMKPPETRQADGSPLSSVVMLLPPRILGLFMLL